VLFGNKKVAVRAPNARVSRRRRRRVMGCGRGVPSQLGRGLCSFPRNRFFSIFFHFWSSKSLVLLHFECCFLSSCTTDGLLWDDLSGSIAYGTERTLKILTAVAFFNVSLYRSTVLFLISSFNPPLLPQRPTPRCVPIFTRN